MIERYNNRGHYTVYDTHTLKYNMHVYRISMLRLVEL